jgi:hypothetical protein
MVMIWSVWKYGARTRERSKAIFSIFWNKISLLFFLCSLHCSFSYDGQRTFVAVQFECLMTQKLLNLVKEWGNIKNCSMISMGLVMSGFILNCFSHLNWTSLFFEDEHLYLLSFEGSKRSICLFQQVITSPFFHSNLTSQRWRVVQKLTLQST